MYTKLQQSRIIYLPNDNLLNVIIKHQANIRLIKFGRLPRVVATKGEYEVKTLADVIIGWANGERTVFADNNTIQCGANRRRSDLDLFLLCRYYFSMPYANFKKQYSILANMRYTLFGNKNTVLHKRYCCTVKRRVHYPFSPKEIELVRAKFKDIKLKINKTPNIGETL